MKDIGYIYVLANSSMPGAVKVGKTTRSTAERSQELSGVTGLPTPFIVVYEQLFEDCTAAEAFVHTILGQKGFRIAENREFFNAPVTEVVRAITLAPGAIMVGGTLPVAKSDETDEFFGDHSQDELDDLSLETDETLDIPYSYAWYSVLEEAEANRYGYGDTLQDEGEALRLYGLAAKLGSLQAYAMMGSMHENGTVIDKEKALKYYKEGARRKNVFCYWKMGVLFQTAEKYQNAEKCFSLFFENMEHEIPDGQHQFLLDWSGIDRDCLALLFLNNLRNAQIPGAVNELIAERNHDLISAAQSMIKTMTEVKLPEVAKAYQLILSQLESIN